VALALAAAASPFALAAVAERQPWPRRVRLTRAAHLTEMATEGRAAVTIFEGRVLDIDDVEVVEGSDAAPPRQHVLIALPGGAIERLALAADTSPTDLRRLRHWRAELIPVLVVDAGTVDLHGPSGIVRGDRLLAVDAHLR
jgi:hypothetical protein